MENAPSTNISVLMPVRNGENFLAKTLNTIARSINNDDEIIIVNDGSTDYTQKILDQWVIENEFKNFQVLNTKGMGLVNALNLGLNESANSWVARYDVDDSYPLERITEQRKFISKDVSAIFCDYSMWSNRCNDIGILPNAIHKSAVAMSLSRSQRTPHPGVLFNRERVLYVGGYIENDFPAEDLSLWLRLSREGNLVGVPKVLLNYRVSRTSISGTLRESAIAQANVARLKFQIPKNDIEFCMQNWEKIFEIYDETPYNFERKILFVYDLIEAMKLCKLQGSLPKSLAKKLLLNFNTYQAGASLIKTKVLKKIAN